MTCTFIAFMQRLFICNFYNFDQMQHLSRVIKSYLHLDEQ
ncbi:hypothetical protein FDUTEX481_00608 [Tolypothrix sp. PCC 7601]|nr:hypothetical protein FDUTEX481_00608 [Tolypothrix sp. PCC 7601]